MSFSQELDKQIKDLQLRKEQAKARNDVRLATEFEQHIRDLEASRFFADRTEMHFNQIFGAQS